ncbi:hypothetical protein BH11PSE11_BH11PSE11_06530 [soil metagenome]
MRSTAFVWLLCTAVVFVSSGCAVVSVAGSAISVGVTASSFAVGAAGTVVKGTVSDGSAVVGTVID